MNKAFSAWAAGREAAIEQQHAAPCSSRTRSGLVIAVRKHPPIGSVRNHEKPNRRSSNTEIL